MRKHLFDFIDAVLLAGIVILALLIARILITDSVQAVAPVTPVTLPAPLPTRIFVASLLTLTPTARAEGSLWANTATPRPTLSPHPTASSRPTESTRDASPSPRPTQTPSATPTATTHALGTTPPTATTYRTDGGTASPTVTYHTDGGTVSLPLHGIYVPSVTPNATTVISNTPVPPPAPLVSLPRGSVTIALLGSDKRPDDVGYRTDTIILVNVNPKLPAVTMLSIPRDLFAYIPGYQFTKINVADERGEFSHFPGGGAGLLKQTIEYNLGIHVDYYARVDFAGFMKLVDTLGGIDVVANCPLEDVFPDDPITENPTITGTLSIQKPGLVHLDGKHALWYARSRQTTSDWDRSVRQQRALRAMWSKANQRGIIARLPEVWADLSTTVKTDLKLNDIVWLATIGAQLDSTRIKGRILDGSVLYHWTTPETKAWVVSPLPDKLGPALEEIFSPPTNVAAQAQVRVEVWNGSPDPDWGLLAADRLMWEGYLVTNIVSADRRDYARTQLIDFSTTPKGSRRGTLASIFRVNAANIVAQPNANSPAQYRVIVGADYQPCVHPRAPGAALPTPTPTATATPGP